MNKSKVVSIFLALVAMIGLGSAGAYKYFADKKESNSASAQPAQANSSMAGMDMDNSMNSMTAELQKLRGDAFDEKFLSLMAEHHAGAVEMAGYVAFDAKHQELRTLGSAIKIDQQSEIEQMRAWAKQWGYTFTEPSQKAIAAMSKPLQGKTGDDLDKQFITDMSIHHTGAIEMAQLAITNAKQPELKNFANKIITAQTKELSDMNTWANQWGYQLEDNPNNPHSSM